MTMASPIKREIVYNEDPLALTEADLKQENLFDETECNLEDNSSQAWQNSVLIKEEVEIAEDWQLAGDETRIYFEPEMCITGDQWTLESLQEKVPNGENKLDAQSSQKESCGDNIEIIDLSSDDNVEETKAIPSKTDAVMVSKYKRKSQRQSWNTRAMLRAIDAMEKWQTGAETFNVRRSTAKCCVLDKNQHATGNKKSQGHYCAVFNDEQEQQLVKQLLDMEVHFYGVTVADLCSLAYRMAEQNNIPNNFNQDKKLAGKGWVRGFRKRHPEIAFRNPEATTAARAQAFNRINVHKFFDILEDVQKRHLYPPHRVYNVDETGVFALRGRRQVGSVKSAERDVLSTFTICMSAGGTFIPPFVIFPRRQMKAELRDGSPPGTAFSCHPSGRMQSEIFTQWFDHFLKYAKPTKDDPVLLLLDGQATHTRNLDLIEKARNNQTTVVCIPPCCSHKLQPLGISFMGHFNNLYIEAMERFLQNNPGRRVTQYRVSRLLGEAFSSAATPAVAINGFRRCGIVPIDRDVFTETDFAADTITEVPNPSVSAPCPSSEDSQESLALEAEETRSADTDCGSADPGNGSAAFTVGSGVRGTECVLISQDSSNCSTSSANYPPIKPSTSALSPHIIKSKQAKKRFSSSFNFDPLQDCSCSSKGRKREVEENSNTIKKGRERYNNKKLVKKKEIQEKNKSKVAQRVLFQNTNSDTDCLYCGDLFSKFRENEGWLRCSTCLNWSHAACVGCEEEDNEFICDLCK